MWSFRWQTWWSPEKVPEYHVWIYHQKKEVGQVVLNETAFEDLKTRFGAECFEARQL